MGLIVSIGAFGQLWRRQWGMALIGVYLLCHAALFVNFMTVNPKIMLWGLTVMMAAVLLWANKLSGDDRSMGATREPRIA